jgi:AraC-like DNA-binding protein
MPTAPGTIATTSTLAMVRAAEARGVRTADLLAAVGLTREGLEDPDARIPAPAVLTLWDRLRERTGDPTLQLAAPTSLPFGAYRVIDFVVAASATVGDGIRRFTHFFGLIADTVSLTIESDGAGEGAGYGLRLTMADGAPVPPLYVDYVFAALVTRIRMRIRPGLRVERVELRQPMPAAAARYAEVFAAPVRFGAPADRLCFSRIEWESAFETADAALVRLLEEHARILAHRLPRAAPGLAAEVQRAIAAALPEGAAAEDVARALHVSVRTLQRRLAAHGTTFRAQVDRVRAQLATEYLADRRVSILEVAFMLGFNDQTAFNRAFRRWTGRAPGRWRKSRVGEDGAVGA